MLGRDDVEETMESETEAGETLRLPANDGVAVTVRPAASGARPKPGRPGHGSIPIRIGAAT